MALGSSAPEILLNVLQTAQYLAEEPPVLGPSTIVGSAAFNLLVISGVSIIGVGEEPKKIEQTGVFAITSIASLFAYIWLYIVLKGSHSEEVVEIWEAVLTLAFFAFLIAFAYTADRCGRMYADHEEDAEELRRKDAKAKLRRFANDFRDQLDLSIRDARNVLVHIAQDHENERTKQISDQHKKEIRLLFVECFPEHSSAKSIPVADATELLQPAALVERSKYRRSKKDPSIRIEGGLQQENETGAIDASEGNPDYGFKCVHYSVSESAEKVEVVVVRKRVDVALQKLGIRTKDDTAAAPKDYQKTELIIDAQAFEKKGDSFQYTFTVPIVNDEEWNPDMDFFIELFDPNQVGSENDQLSGKDAQCKVTILDEDKPGTIGFADTEVRVARSGKELELVVVRTDGSDGRIQCVIKTEMINSTSGAKEFDHYLPCTTKLTFNHNDSETRHKITLMPAEDGDLGKAKGDEGDEGNLPEEDESEEEEQDLVFKVKLEEPSPEGVKVGANNLCFVTIVGSDEHAKDQEHREKMLNFYLEQQDPTWEMQFRNACVLSPVMNEDEYVVEDVGAFEAFSHFCSIFWKLVFALIPPSSMCNGYVSFWVSLAFVGIVTWVVGEVATVLGCALSIRESVTAITLVALGTSLPDTFASMTAAANSENADAAIGNITGSNSVNVFLGLGLPWLMGSTYFAANMDTPYYVPAGALAFSVFVFLIVAVICFVVLVARRVFIGGELGGPEVSKYWTGCFLFFLWFIYILLSTLQAYGIIGGFN